MISMLMSEGMGAAASSTVDITKAHTLYAHLRANAYVILFDAGGGIA